MASVNVVVESGAASTLLDTVAPKDSPVFTTRATLPENTIIGSVNSVEIAYLNGLTDNIQSQIDAIKGVSGITGNLYLPRVTTNSAGSQITGAIVFEGLADNDYDVSLGIFSGPAQSIRLWLPTGVDNQFLVGEWNTTTIGNKTLQYSRFITPASPSAGSGTGGAPLQFPITPTTNPTFYGTLTVPYLTADEGIKNIAGAPYVPTYWNVNSGSLSLGLLTANQNYPVFTNSALTLRANSFYRFETYVYVTTTTSVTTGVATTFDLIGDGTITGATVYSNTHLLNQTTVTFNSSSGSSVSVTSSGTAGVNRSFKMTGTIRTGSTGGTIKPSIKVNATQTNATSVDPTSYIYIQPLGTSSDYQAGGWA